MKSCGLSSNEQNTWKISLNEHGTTQFESQENANIFKKFHYDLNTDLKKSLSIAPIEFCRSNTKGYCADTNNDNKKNEFHLSEVAVKKLSSLKKKKT